MPHGERMAKALCHPATAASLQVATRILVLCGMIAVALVFANLNP